GSSLHAAIPPEIYPLSLHDALPISRRRARQARDAVRLLELTHVDGDQLALATVEDVGQRERGLGLAHAGGTDKHEDAARLVRVLDRKSTRLNSSHVKISYAVFGLKK